MARDDLRQRQGEKRADWIARVAATQRAERPAPPPRFKKQKQRAPVYGSQQWAETRGDDLGESHD